MDEDTIIYVRENLGFRFETLKFDIQVEGLSSYLDMQVRSSESILKHFFKKEIPFGCPYICLLFKLGTM